MGMKSSTHCYCEFEASWAMIKVSPRICTDSGYKWWSGRWFSHSSNQSLSPSINSLFSKEWHPTSTIARKMQRLSDDDSGDNDSSDSPKEETEENVSSEETSMNQLDTSVEKLFANRACSSDDGDTTLPSSEPHTPESHRCSDELSNDNDDDSRCR
jgi:hypothetical protein